MKTIIHKCKKGTEVLDAIKRIFIKIGYFPEWDCYLEEDEDSNIHYMETVVGNAPFGDMKIIIQLIEPK
jgi:hypothetical protein